MDRGFTYTDIPVGPRGTDAVTQHFQTLEEATTFCASGKNEIKYGHMESLTWQERELHRQNTGVYTLLSEYGEFQDIAHILFALRARMSSDKTKIIFIPDHKHGVLDRTVSMRPGRFFTNYTSLTSSEIIEYVSLFETLNDDDLVLMIGKTRLDFKTAYVGENAPRSCMSERFRLLPAHPVEVYAAGDLGIATLRRKNAINNILVRSIVFPERKVFSRIYGKPSQYAYINRFIRILKSQGYESVNDFIGARLLKIPTRRFFDRLKTFLGFPCKEFLMPWMDFAYCVEDKGDHFVIADGSRVRRRLPPFYRCQNTRGYITLN